MALPTSGAISLANVNTELGVASNTTRSLNDAAVRSLFGKASGVISMSDGYGKSSSYKATISTHQKELNLRTWMLANGWDGASSAEITIGAGVYIWSDNTAVAALTTGSFPGGLTIINNGYIIGRGGNGAKGSGYAYGNNYTGCSAGGPALSLSQSCSIQNNSYIAGGGGGGAGSVAGAYKYGGGGGGAGGGQGGGWNQSLAVLTTSGGAVGATGQNGWMETFSTSCSSFPTCPVGGAGGRILPGAGGAAAGTGIAYGGGSGGGGTWPYGANGGIPPGSGGSANNPGGNGGATNSSNGCGGGGGWGASGGSCFGESGAAGGKAVQLNGFSVTWLATGTRYGAVA